MKLNLSKIIVIFLCTLTNSVFCQNDSAYTTVKTYTNPILSGDHPDPTLLKVGNDFYSCGSSFHLSPFLPILHSTDLVHWHTISRVVPSDWSVLKNETPGSGIWQGAITYFYDSYWIYFSNTWGGQYFSKAKSPLGPWSTPVKMNTTLNTGASGYDNSIFVDDDGTPYMLIKSGQYENKIQKIGQDGHLIDPVINLDWINAKKQYSWAEGPVMCKRNGWYYYFVAGNVSGGQYVLRTQQLTSDSTAWTRMGSFFESTTDAACLFRRPNHISQPFRLADGTWWTISHCYERNSNGSNDWSAQGRQGLLHQVTWDDNGKPTGSTPTSLPMSNPNLPKTEIPWLLPRSDSFNSENLNLNWYFLNKTAASQYSLTKKNGWLTITPGVGRSHILQKSSEHFSTIVSRVCVPEISAGQEAGLYITNGNNSINIKLCMNYSNGKKITFYSDSLKFSYQTNNVIGDTVWFKCERNEHVLTGYYSMDGKVWSQVGSAVSVTALDCEQTSYNWWIGNSIGLYAEGREAYFDAFTYKDAFSSLPVIGYNNFFGIEKVSNSIGSVITNSTEKGGWLMLGGVDLGLPSRASTKVNISAATISGGTVEVWVDDIENNGKLIATIPVTATRSLSDWQIFTANITEIYGQHDLFLRLKANQKSLLINTIQFTPTEALTSNTNLVAPDKLSVYPNPFSINLHIDYLEPFISYSIYDLAGKITETNKVNSSTTTIGESLNKGIYILKVNTNNTPKTFKITKI